MNLRDKLEEEIRQLQALWQNKEPGLASWYMAEAQQLQKMSNTLAKVGITPNNKED